jgi:hypothetical protein
MSRSKGKKNPTQKELFIERIYKLRLKNPARHTPGAAASKEDQSPHLSSLAKVRGNLAPGSHLYTFSEDKLKQTHVQSYYSWNAWNYIGSKADASRDIYSSARLPEYRFFDSNHRPNFYQLYPTQALGSHADAHAQHQQATDRDLRRYYRRKKSIAWVSENLQLRTQFIGTTLPYPWQAHHLLPANVFHKNLTMEQIKIILRSDYDINDGRNIIFLPEQPIDTPAHSLPYHASGHPAYDKKVTSLMSDLKKILTEVEKKNMDHKLAAAKVEEELHKLETTMFKYTRSLGKKPRQKLK